MSEDPKPPPPRWAEEFPYEWDSDELVARRELLNFAVYASGALFAGAVAMAILGRRQTKLLGAPMQIARVDEVPIGQAHYFRYPNADDEAVLLHLPGDLFVAFSQRCTHLSCSVVFEPERNRLYCPCHDGVFEPRTGAPIAGPPRRPLQPIAIKRDGDWIVATGVVA